MRRPAPGFPGAGLLHNTAKKVSEFGLPFTGHWGTIKLKWCREPVQSGKEDERHAGKKVAGWHR